MPVGLVRRIVRERVSPGPARALVALAMLASACSSGTPASPGIASTVGNADGRASAPSGLEQRLTTKVQTPPPGSPYTALLAATSTLVNTGSAPVHVIARTCLATDADIETTAKMDRFEPFVSCAAVSVETDLAPGQSIGPLEAHFGVRSGSGEYTLTLRHALTPELRAKATFQVP